MAKAGMAAALALSAAMLGAAGAQAHQMGKIPNTPGGRAFQARHENFKQLGAAFKQANDELKKKAPNRRVLAAQGAKIGALGGQAASWFPVGSGPVGRIPTEAKASIWTDRAGFAAAAERLKGESAKFQTIAASGDLAATRQQARALGQACKSCHDKFRVERHS